MPFSKVRHWFKMDEIITGENNPTGMDTIKDSVRGGYVFGVKAATPDSIPQFKRWQDVPGGVPNTCRVFCSGGSYMSHDGGPRNPRSPYRITVSQQHDFMMVVAARARVPSAAQGDPVAPDPVYAGSPTFDLFVTDPQEEIIPTLIQVRPNFAGYGLRSINGTITDGYCHLLQRDNGTDYVLMLVKRGDTFEHYVGWDDRQGNKHYVMADSIAELLPGIFSRFEFTNQLQFSHVWAATPRGSVDELGTPGCGASDLGETFNKAQDYYGALIIDFDQGAPTQQQCIRSMKWHLEHWRDGDKSIYPLCLSGCCH